MSNRIKNNLKNLVGQTLNQYYSKVKPTISDLRYKQEYQNRIIECMVGEVDDNYITTPETDNPIVKLEHSKEGLVKVPSIKGKTILVDAEGNETDTPGEGCRLVSVGEDEDNKLIILSKNKNLFDGELELGSISTSHGGNISHTECLRSKNYIKVRPNTTIIQSNDLGYVSVVNVYDKDKNLIAYLGSKNPFTIPENGEYIRFRSSTSTSQNNLNVKYQFEEGNKATNYVEPKSHKTEILLDEPLRSLPNGVCDEIIGNKLIKRIGKFTIDGTQMIHVWNNSTGDTVNGYLYYHYFKNLTNVKDYGCVFNAILPSNKGGYTAIEEGIIITAYVAFSIHKDKLGIEDVNDYIENEKIVTQWFTENPIEVLYELEEPIIEELPNSITIQGFDDTTMYIENSITPTVQYGYNALIPYKEELLTQKEEVETNTLDIEQNIIPYLMDMEFNLMLMEDN